MADIFIEIEGIKGESRDALHKETIEPDSLSLGCTQPAAAGPFSGRGGHSAAKVVFQDIHFTKGIDSASPELFARVCDGKHIAKATIYFYRAQGDKKHQYRKIVLTDVMVSSLATSASGPHVSESVSIAFAKIGETYVPMSDLGKPGTAVERSWNLAENTP